MMHIEIDSIDIQQQNSDWNRFNEKCMFNQATKSITY